MSAPRAPNGSIPEYEEIAMNGDDEGLSYSASRVLSMRDPTHPTPHLTTSSDPNPQSNALSGLFDRRGGRRTSPPFTPPAESPTTRVPSTQTQYLRPITPTQPLMEDGEARESSTIDTFTQDGPMTPTNNAGPFVFDGSAGRVVGRAGVDALSETEISLEA